MVGRRFIVMLVIAGLLVFGCTAPQGQSNNTSAGGGTAAGGGPLPSGGATTTAGGGAATTGGGTTGGGTAATGGETGGGGGSLAGKAWGDLVALGVPVQCDITTTYSGKTTTVRVYMKGSDLARSEVPTPDSPQCKQIISIVKGNTYYMGCGNGNLFGSGFDCQWIKFEATGEAAAPTSLEKPSYENVPSTQISCIPWVYDGAKFDTAGKVCTMQDIMGGYAPPPEGNDSGG